MRTRGAHRILRFFDYARQVDDNGLARFALTEVIIYPPPLAILFGERRDKGCGDRGPVCPSQGWRFGQLCRDCAYGTKFIRAVPANIEHTGDCCRVSRCQGLPGGLQSVRDGTMEKISS